MVKTKFKIIHPLKNHTLHQHTHTPQYHIRV